MEYTYPLREDYEKQVHDILRRHRREPEQGKAGCLADPVDSHEMDTVLRWALPALCPVLAISEAQTGILYVLQTIQRKWATSPVITGRTYEKRIKSFLEEIAKLGKLAGLLDMMYDASGRRQSHIFANPETNLMQNTADNV
jgi:hypothetical protein